MNHRQRWPETLAITTLLVLAIVLAAGWAALPPLIP